MFIESKKAKKTESQNDENFLPSKKKLSVTLISAALLFFVLISLVIWWFAKLKLTS